MRKERNSRMIRVRNEDVEILNELHRLDPHSQDRISKLHSILHSAKNGVKYTTATGVVTING